MEAKALANFELFHELPRGTAKVNWIKASKEGVAGWANWSSGKQPPGAAPITIN